MWRNAESVFLQLPRELQPALQKRLSMFVMRAKAKLADAGDLVVLGLGGAAAEAALRPHFAALPAAPYGKLDSPLGTLIRVADAFGAPRYQWLTTPATAAAVLPALRATLALGGNQAWQLSAIHAAVPQITLKTQEQFVPQMINFELLGGVNFKKGCYPGQEIVARSQYLGKLKRRAALVTIAGADAQAGDEVFAVDDPGQPCGMVVNAAPNGAGGTDALVELKLAALEAGDIRLGSADGARAGIPADALPARRARTLIRHERPVHLLPGARAGRRRAVAAGARDAGAAGRRTRRCRRSSSGARKRRTACRPGWKFTPPRPMVLTPRCPPPCRTPRCRT